MINEYNGLSGDRGIGVLEGIIARVENFYCYTDEHDIYKIGAFLMSSIAKGHGHGFNDANKRTALLCFLKSMVMKFHYLQIFPIMWFL